MTEGTLCAESLHSFMGMLKEPRELDYPGSELVHPFVKMGKLTGEGFKKLGIREVFPPASLPKYYF